MIGWSEILERLPHRPPFLLLDRVLGVEPGRAWGYKNITMNEPQFRGHFPGNPVLPGVLTIESLLQLTWILYSGLGSPRLAGIDRLKFRRQVKPGDRLDLEVQEVEIDGEYRRVRVRAQVDGQVASEGILTLFLEASSGSRPDATCE